MDEVAEAIEKYQGLVPLVYDIEKMSLDVARPEDMQYAVYLKREADKAIDKLEESIRKQKYWRCLARAKNAERMATHFIMLFSETNVSKLKTPYLNKMKIYYKWQKLWLKLAEKFKQNSTAR